MFLLLVECSAVRSEPRRLRPKHQRVELNPVNSRLKVKFFQLLRLRTSLPLVIRPLLVVPGKRADLRRCPRSSVLTFGLEDTMPYLDP